LDGIIKAAQELSEIYKRKIEERTEKDNNKIAIFEMLKHEKLDEDKILDTILDLAVSEDKKEIYLNRYACNHRLLKTEKGVEEMLDDGIVPKPIRLNAKDIGKAVLTGKNSVDLITVMGSTREAIERDGNCEEYNYK